MSDVSRLLESIRKLYHLDKVDEAIHFCDELLKHDKKNYEAQLYKASSLSKKEEYNDAKKIFDRLCKQNPKDVRALLGRAYNYAGMGELKKSNQLFFKAKSIDASNQDAHFHYALTLERLNELDRAKKAVEEGMKTVGEYKGLLYISALLDRREKKYKEAIKSILKIQDDMEPEYVANKYFELMHNYHAIGEYEKAFSSLEMGQEKRKEFLMRQNLMADKNEYLALVNTYKDYVDGLEVFNPVYEAGEDARGLCFFVGFPRSGTTLAQQMLQAHPDVETMEEKDFLSHMCSRFLQENGKNFHALSDMTADQIQEYRDYYFTEVAKCVPTKKYKLLVDKMPLSMVHVPMIRMVFPEAKILMILRHPCDSIFSCMMQNFDPNIAMMNFTNLHDGAVLYDKVFSLFEKSVEVFQPPVHKFRYEDVIEDTEAVLKEVCDFLELKWEEDMLDYREKIVDKAELIRTPSFRQVVEPINQSAKYRWLKYKEHFNDVLPTLKPHMKRYGYSDQ